MNPAPLDELTPSATGLHARLKGLIRDTPRQPDEVRGVYSSVIAPSVIPGDTPRFLVREILSRTQ
jgi:aromatic-L-amino-acid/L-tryptophan decarboxylase